uniref:Imidazoleglycerol-phosphate dehydratase n=1 Tax=Populus alba TaxID=43335 RepID=A0A4U5NLC7_POPAL|nr:Imidazoleglycerol-phosphate dehydratase 1 [Populus alba]
MASTKINFDTKELQFDLLMGLSGAISARRWRRIYCREMQAMVWRLVADMWRCSSVDDQQTKLPRFVLSLLIDSSALSGAGKIAREKKAAVIKRRRYKFRCLHVGDSLMKLRKGLETSGMDVVAVPRHLQSRTATPSLTKPRRSTIIFQRNLVVPTRIHYPCPHTFSSTPLLMDSHAAATTTTSKPLQAYRSSLTNSSSIESPASARIGEVKRVTNETNVSVKFNLDGTGIADSTTGIPFLDHILDQLSSHGLFDVHVRATGDIHIDDHHTNEDVALAIGTACFPLGDRKGINRFGDFSAPLDEALIHVSLLTPLPVPLPSKPDKHLVHEHVIFVHAYAISMMKIAHLNPLRLCLRLLVLENEEEWHRYDALSVRWTGMVGSEIAITSVGFVWRPYLGYDLQIPTQRVGTYDTQLAEHFFQSLVNTSGMTLHIRQLAGRNSHHIIEATFKAFARALRQATEYDPRRLGTVPSSKGVLSRT